MNMEKVRKHRNIKLVTTEKKKGLFSIRTKLSYYKVFHRTSISNGNEKKKKKTEMLKYKPVYLGFSKIELSKILMYEFWYDYVKCKYGEEAQMFI